jgi:hypothetical protein
MNEFGEHTKRFYPELKDIQEASSLIQNAFLFGIFNYPELLSAEERKQLLDLLYKWNMNYAKYKKDSVEALIKEINEINEKS